MGGFRGSEGHRCHLQWTRSHPLRSPAELDHERQQEAEKPGNRHLNLQAGEAKLEFFAKVSLSRGIAREFCNHPTRNEDRQQEESEGKSLGDG
jgi:hypothetical protein